MKWNEILNEIAYSNAVGNIDWNEGQIISDSVTIGKIDQRDVHSYTQGNTQLIFFTDSGKSKLDAFVLIEDGKYLRGLKNNIGGGLITALMAHILGTLISELWIGQDEPLTPAGILWVKKIISNSVGGFKIVTSDAHHVTTELLTKMWNNARVTGEPNNFAMKITFNGTPLKESNNRGGLFFPMVRYASDKELI